MPGTAQPRGAQEALPKLAQLAPFNVKKQHLCLACQYLSKNVFKFMYSINNIIVFNIIIKKKLLKDFYNICIFFGLINILIKKLLEKESATFVGC